MSSGIQISVEHRSQTVEYAASELAKYLCTIGGCSSAAYVSSGEAAGRKEITLGLFSDFDIAADGLENPEMDDAIKINIKNSNGYIAGSNPRSVLIGVYRFLESVGCRWLRPGKDGDYVPQKETADLCAEIEEKASYRHRGMCIEGAVSLENMMDSVEWCPKVGLNTYMMEFSLPYAYFERWYSHDRNPFKSPESRTLEECYAYKTAIASEIKKRGMTYHDMGHGWTCSAVGLPTENVKPWDRFLSEIPPSVQKRMDKYLALVDGKREIQNNAPLNTNLCYGNPEVRDRIVEDMLAYCREHPEVDVLHFWLGDSWNTQCECELCVDTTPSDFMIMICNQLDEAMTREGIDTQVAFISYVDTMWPPNEERIKNPDRFLLLYAPISRTYSNPYEANTGDVKLQPYVRNQLPKPRNVKENLGYLREWFEVFDGDSLCFEYHFWKDHYNDPGYYSIAQILCQDIKSMHDLGLNGIIEDQTQRAYFPTGFPQYLYGKTLWDDSNDCSALAEEYFAAAFGNDWKACLEYMKTISELFDPEYLRGDRGDAVNSEAAKKLDTVADVVSSIRDTAASNIDHEERSVGLSWEYLMYHTEIVELLSYALKERAEGNTSAARRYWEQLSRFVCAHEDQLQPALDVHSFVRFTSSKFY